MRADDDTHFHGFLLRGLFLQVAWEFNREFVAHKWFIKIVLGNLHTRARIILKIYILFMIVMTRYNFRSFFKLSFLARLYKKT